MKTALCTVWTVYFVNTVQTTVYEMQIQQTNLLNNKVTWEKYLIKNAAACSLTYK